MSKGNFLVLCLHGYKQNETVFREKTGAFRRLVKNRVNFVFMTAPMVLQTDDAFGPRSDEFGWWVSEQGNEVPASYTYKSEAFNKSVSAIADKFASEGPFDGILGFSQGGAMCAALCALQETLPFKFHFAIFISSYISSQHQHLFTQPIHLPSLHIFGMKDKVINNAMSEQLLQCFVKPKIVSHEGGHFVPALKTNKEFIFEFLDDIT